MVELTLQRNRGQPIGCKPLSRFVYSKTVGLVLSPSTRSVEILINYLKILLSFPPYFQNYFTFRYKQCQGLFLSKLNVQEDDKPGKSLHLLLSLHKETWERISLLLIKLWVGSLNKEEKENHGLKTGKKSNDDTLPLIFSVSSVKTNNFRQCCTK